MDYFDPDTIERTAAPVVTPQNLPALLSSRNIPHKLLALEYLSTHFSPGHFKLLLESTRYPLPEISQKAFQILLRVLPTVPATPSEDKDILEVLLWRVIPWVNEQVVSAAEAQAQEFNNTLTSGLDTLLPRVDRAILNSSVLGAMTTPNYKVQIAACQVTIHLYLAVPDKTRLSLADLFEVLLSNYRIGVKELKRNCLNVMSAVYKVFGLLNLESGNEAVSELLDRLGNPEQVDSVKKRAEVMQIKEAPVKPPMRKSVVNTPVAKGMASSSSRGNLAPVSGDGGQQDYKVNFDQFIDEEGSTLMLGFEDKWVKKMQIIKVEDGIVNELQKLYDELKVCNRVLYYPEVNKNSLLLLKNYLINPSKKVVSLTISVLNKLIKGTARTLQDGFPLFYPELIEKLKSKSKQDGEIIEALIFLSSNVSLANFLRRVQKDFAEKSSVLRINLIEIVSTLLNNKENYNPAEAKKAANVLVDLKKFSETELSKDVSNAVRLMADRIPSAIQRNFHEELAWAAQESVAKEEPPTRKSMIPRVPAQSTIMESVVATPPPAMVAPIPRTSSSIKPPTANVDPLSRLSTLRKERREEQANSGNKSVEKQLSTSEWVGEDSRHSAVKHSRTSIGKLPSLADVTPDTEIEWDLDLLSRLHLEKKDPAHKAKLADTFRLVAGKVRTAAHFEQLVAHLARVKEDTKAGVIVGVLMTGFERTGNFPAGVMRTFLPCLLAAPVEFLEEPPREPVRRNSARFDTADSRNSVRADRAERTKGQGLELVDRLLEKFGPVFFFQIFENTLVDRDLFSSADVEPLFSLFLRLLVKVPPEYHPVMTVLSLLRGFVYFACHTLSNRLGELAFVMLHVYGKVNFRCFKKEFEVCGISETVVDVAKWTPLDLLGDAETLGAYASVPFKDKILNEKDEFFF